MLATMSVGSYRILGRISSGGMGDVYLGEDIYLKRRVAIKALKPELANDPDVIKRFKLEAVTLAQLNHPNVATVYAFLGEGSNHYLVIELISGWELGAFIDKVGSLPLPLVLYLYRQVLVGISAVHAKGIVHRDLKPANIMVTEGLTVKVMDFGIARFQTGDRLTRHSKLIGTMEYMAPEQILGKEATPASDIYSLGVLLFEMVTGHAPFSGNSEYEVMKSQVENPPPSPLEFTADIPSKLLDILSRALAKAPEDRYPSVEAFIKALDEISVNINDATSTLRELIRTHQLEKNKNIEYRSSLTEFEHSQKRMPRWKVSNQKMAPLPYLGAIYDRFISALVQRPWLGPVILFCSFLTVGGLVWKSKATFGSSSPLLEKRAHESIDGKIPAEMMSQEVLKTNDSRHSSESIAIYPRSIKTNNNMSLRKNLNQEDGAKRIPDHPAKPVPEAKSQPVHRDQSPTGIPKTRPPQEVKTLSRQPLRKTNKEVGIDQAFRVEKPRTKVQSEPTDDQRRGGGEWIIHK